MAGRSADTAEILILIGLILQVVTVLILFAAAAFLSAVPILGGIVLLFAILGLFFVILVYIFSYARTKDGDYEGARTPTLVFGILSLISLGLISGILYIVAFVKLGDAADEEDGSRTDWILHGGTSSVPSSQLSSESRGLGTGFSAARPTDQSSAGRPVFCTACGQPNGAGSRYCRNCGSRIQ